MQNERNIKNLTGIEIQSICSCVKFKAKQHQSVSLLSQCKITEVYPPEEEESTSTRKIVPKSHTLTDTKIFTHQQSQTHTHAHLRQTIGVLSERAIHRSNQSDRTHRQRDQQQSK